MKNDEILVTGYAKLPQGITATELYTIVGMSILLERNTSLILDLDCTLATQVARDFVKRLVVGKHLKNLEEIEACFEESYFGSAKKAIISAIRTCNERYLQL